MNSRFYIIGIKHCGKSTVGLMLSKAMNIPFYDLDEIIENRVNMSVREFYISKGKEAFQLAETEAITILQAYKGGFICATGGGICDNIEAFNLLKKLSNSIYINTAFETVYERIIKNGIPPFLKTKDPKEEFKVLYTRRNILYNQMAYIEVDGNNITPVEISDKITEILKEPQIAGK